MLPSAVRDRGLAMGGRPMPDLERGRPGNIGEGRRSNSRSSSHDSNASPKVPSRPSSPDSGDEATDHSNMEQDNQSNSSLVRPSLGFKWRDGLAKTAFGSFGSGSGSFAKHATSKSSVFTASERMPNNTSQGASPSVPVQHTMSTILPTKVRLPSHSRLSDERSSFKSLLTTPVQSTMPTILPTKIRFPVNDRQVSQNISTAQTQNNISSSKSPGHTLDKSAYVAPLLENNTNEVGGYTSNLPTSINTAQLPSSLQAETRSSDVQTPSMNITSQDTSCSGPLTVAPVRSAPALPNTLSSGDATVSAVHSSPPDSTPNPTPLGGLVNNMPISIHNFFQSPVAYPSSTGSGSSASIKSSQTLAAVTAVLPDAHQEKTSSSVADSVQSKEASLDPESEDKDIPQDNVREKKKGGKTRKTHVRKKRGDWRVQNYVNSAAAPSDPSQPQFYFTGAHQPAFKASDPVTNMTVLSASFLPSEIASKPINEEGLAKSSRTMAVSTGPSELITHDLISSSLRDSSAFDDMIDDGMDSSHPLDIDAPLQSSSFDYQSHSHGSANNDHQFPSQSRESSVTKSWPSMHQSNKDRTTTAMNPVEPSMRGTTVARRPVVASHQPSTTPEPMHSEQSSDIPSNPGLVNVVVKDTRLDWDKPSLVEMMVPLRRAENDTFWADAVDVCNILQGGPSRIDGPAKAYVLRSEYKVYFLRVSTENVDNYVSANLFVPTDRTLRVFVESIIPPVTFRSATSSASLYQTRIPYSPIDPTHLASPAPSGSPDYSHASLPGGPGSYTPHELKRNRSDRISRRTLTDTEFEPPVSEVPSKRKKEDSSRSSGPRQYYRS